MRIDLYGCEIEVFRRESGWDVFYPGADGKRRIAKDIVIPAWIDEEELAGYLNDLFHEHATPEHPTVRVLK